jgi:putative spermidine/putrescine transport system substrate-binding protein
VPTASRPTGDGLSRRTILKTAAAVAGSSASFGAIAGFPAICAQNIKDVVPRHNGTPVTAIPAICDQANKDLGFTVKMQATEGNELLNRLLSAPSWIDCADISITFMKYRVSRDILQAIP